MRQCRGCGKLVDKWGDAVEHLIMLIEFELVVSRCCDELQVYDTGAQSCDT